MSTRREIQPLRTLEDLKELEQLQKSIWRFDEREIVPLNELVTLRDYGGVLLQARDNRREEMIGFVFGMPGIRDGNLIHCSRMLGVVPDHREYDLGFRLKREQRKEVLDRDMTEMVWTYDPLLSVNAFFNLVKLGATVSGYEENAYGSESTSHMNMNWETDRFKVIWSLNDSDVIRCVEEQEYDPLAPEDVLENEEYTRINTVERDFNDTPTPKDAHLDYRRGNLFVEIPYNVLFIKSENLELAREWRQHTRAIFQEYLRRDYEVINVVSGKLDTRKYRSYYVLDR